MGTALLERPSQSSRVDRERGVIRGVKILGMKSKNGRTYKPAALRQAVQLYEGAKVNTDHPDRKDATRDRRVSERLGSIRNVRFEADGLYADFYINPNHEMAGKIFWAADNAPGDFGFSPQHGLTMSKGRDGRDVVEAITGVRSVDLVADPATTDGFFESYLPDFRSFAQRIRDVNPVNQMKVSEFARALRGRSETSFQGSESW